MKTLSPLTTKGAIAWSLSGVTMLALSLWLDNATARLPLALGGAALLGAMAAVLVHPWLGPRTLYRVRYHAPAEAPVLPLSVAHGLGALASEGGAVSLVWRRDGGELSLFLEAPAGLDEVIRGMLPRLLPYAALEAVSSYPHAGTWDKSLYSWSIARTGTTGMPNALDYTCLVSNAIFAGDCEIRIHMTRGGVRVLAQGTPGLGAGEAGLRPVLSPLVSLLSRSAPKPRTSRPASSRAGIRLARTKDNGSGLPACVWLLRRYPFFEPLAQADSGGRAPLAMRFPLTSLSSTRPLDSRISSEVVLPDTYAAPCSDKALLLGIATADGRHVGIPFPNGTQESREVDTPSTWSRHFLAVGEAEADRNRVVRMLADQVVSHGGGLVFLDSSGSEARRIASQLPAEAISRRSWIDMDNPANSLRLNLLSVPPLPACENSAIAEAKAAVCALRDVVPLLGGYLEQLGITGWAGASGCSILMDWAKVLLSVHHRARLESRSGTGKALAPDLRTLYELLSESEVLPTLVAQERSQWSTPSALLATAMREAGDAGKGTREIVLDLLSSVEGHLGTTSPAERRVMSAAIRDQLRPIVCHPSLQRLWSAPMVAAPDFLGREPGPVLLARLPLHGVSHLDAMAARWYGSYLLSCIAATARWRLCSGTSGPPLLVVLQDARAWLNGTMSSLLSAHMQVLGRAGIAVLTNVAELPTGTEGEWLLDSTGTWWVHSLKRDAAGTVRERLKQIGIAADLSLATMSAGIALLKFPGPDGPIAATVHAGGTYPNASAIFAQGNSAGERTDDADVPSSRLSMISD